MNPWHAPRLLNLIADALFAAAVLALVAAGASWFAHRPWFALRALVVEPVPGETLRHVSEPLLRSAGAGSISGTFFTVDLAAVRAKLEAVPWVRHASVRRVWPDRLQVQVEEHRPFATWDDGRLVNTQGELFAANVAEAEEDGALPAFAGPPGSTPELMKRWRELHEWLAPTELRPVGLTLSPRWAWSAQLDNGATLLLGREQDKPIAERVAAMVAVWPKVSQRMGATEAIDLRYANGFAVRAPFASAISDKNSRNPGSGSSARTTSRAAATPPAGRNAAAAQGQR